MVQDLGEKKELMTEASRKNKLSSDAPLVTVITVVLNNPSGLEKTINNILSQTFENIEYIVIDGGSSDSTLDVIKKYKNKIDSWISEPDNGIYDAMNKGIELASGDFINFMNAGDTFYQPDTVENVFKVSPYDADFIYGHTYFLGGDYRGIVEAWDINILWATMIFTHQSLFVKSAILKKRKFNLKYKITCDYELIYSSFIKGYKFFNSNQVIAYFSPGFSETSRARMAFERWNIVRRYRNDIGMHWFYWKLILTRFVQDHMKKFRKARA